MNNKVQKKFSFFMAIALLIAGISYLYKDRAMAPEELTFKIIDGRQLTLEQYRGKPVLINFWATNCSYCILEMPGMIKVYDELSDQGFELIGVAMPYDSPDLVLKAVKDLGINFPIALDVDGEAVQAFGGISATPMHFLISPEGQIVERIPGALHPDKLRAKIKAMLAKVNNAKKII